MVKNKAASSSHTSDVLSTARRALKIQLDLRTQAHPALVLHAPPSLGPSPQNAEAWTRRRRRDGVDGARTVLPLSWILLRHQQRHPSLVWYR